MMFAKLYDRCRRVLHDPRKVFLISLGAGAVVSLVSLVAIADIYRDVAGVYAYYAREIGSDGLAAGWVGRVPMLNILLAGGLARIGFDAYRACVFVSCMFYVLTLFPLRRYLERWLSPLAAAYGCLLFVVTPKVIRFSVSGVIDSARYFFLICALLFMFRLIESPSRRRVVAFGFSAAGLAVSRGEGVVVSLLLLLVPPLFAALGRGCPKRVPAARRIAAALAAWVVFFVGIFPFCIGNYLKYNAFVPDIRFAEQIPALNRNLRNHRIGDRHVSTEVVRHEGSQRSRAGRIAECFNDSFRGGYEVYWVFTGIGFLTLLYRRKWRWEFTALLALYLFHQALYFSISLAYRYSIYLVPMFMPFTVSGMAFCLDMYGRWRPLDRWRPLVNTAAVVGFAVAAVVSVLNGMQIALDRVDDSKRAAAAFIREWGERNVPGRRLRLAGDGDFPEVVYWSGALCLNDYDHCLKWDQCLDCDLVFVGDRDMPIAEKRSDLKFLKSFMLREKSKKQGHLFQVVTPSAGKEPK